MPPSGENIDAIRESILDSLDADNVVDSPELTREWEGRLSSAEYRLFGSEALQLLREHPRTAAEIPGNKGMNYFPGEKRQFVRQLTVGAQLGQAEKPGERRPRSTPWKATSDERSGVSSKPTRRSSPMPLPGRPTDSNTNGVIFSTACLRRSGGSGCGGDLSLRSPALQQ
jgi:hypothetical protein